jgi:F420H(2)-dependent quinone reductase
MRVYHGSWVTLADVRRSATGAGALASVLFDRLGGRWAYRLHRYVYELSGGRLGQRSPFGPLLLLTTVGRRTGKPRTTPLLYLPDGEDYVVVASNGGRDEPPAWLRNLEATPDARVRVGREVHRVYADVLWGARADVMWPRLTAHHAGWRTYQRLTDREIPVVRLTRRS